MGEVLAEYRGQGYGKDALGTLLDFYFNRIGGALMHDEIALDNRAGQRLLASVGFEVVHTGADAYRMEITAPAGYPGIRWRVPPGW